MPPVARYAARCKEPAAWSTPPPLVPALRLALQVVSSAWLAPRETMTGAGSGSGARTR
jgi:hypothetical protein